MSMNSMASQGNLGQQTRLSRNNMPSTNSMADHRIRQERAQHQRIGATLRKGKIFRNEEDIAILGAHLKDFRAFFDMPQTLMDQLCRIMTMSQYEPGHAVFNQGDAGQEWFIILTGQVVIQKDGKTLVSLTTGAGFGELALINDAPRSASVITEIKTELIRVDKWDYDR
jgi:hypothetical protein